MPSRELTKTEKKYNKKEIFVLKEVFDDADVDGSGEIDLAELRKALNKTNLGNAAEDMFKAIDKDGSKKIGFDEYLKVRSPAPDRRPERHLPTRVGVFPLNRADHSLTLPFASFVFLLRRTIDSPLPKRSGISCSGYIRPRWRRRRR